MFLIQRLAETTFEKKSRFAVNAGSVDRQVFYWLPIVLLSNYVSPSYSGIMFLSFFALPAMSGLLALNYGQLAIVAVAIGGATHLVGYAADWGTLAPDPGIYLLSLVVAYIFSDKRRLLNIRSGNSDVKVAVGIVVFIVLALFQLNFDQALDDEGSSLPKLIVSISFYWLSLGVAFWAGYTKYRMQYFALLMIFIFVVMLITRNSMDVELNEWKLRYVGNLGFILAMISMYLSGAIVKDRLAKRFKKTNTTMILLLCGAGYIAWDIYIILPDNLATHFQGASLHSMSFFVSSGFLFGLYFATHGGLALMFGVGSSAIILVVAAILGEEAQVLLTNPLLWYLYYRFGRKVATRLSG